MGSGQGQVKGRGQIVSIRDSWQQFTVRRLDMGPLLDLFLISAISCVLVIRFVLYLTDYPQIGNETLHIAHMLWGGLGMLLAIVVLFAFPTRVAIQFAAFVGGLGFGAFIDELGKFITSDNDYFFQPTIGLIYLVFIVLYLTFRRLEEVAKPSQATALVNALELTKEAALRTMDPGERDRALQLLARCDQQDALVGGLTATLHGYRTVAAPEPGLASRVRDAMVRFYKRLIGWRWFGGLLVTAVVVIALVGLGTAVAAVLSLSPGEFSFHDWGSLVSAIASGLLVVAGVLFYRRSRMLAYQLFDSAVLVGIFVGQVFAFAENQLGAIGGLIFLLVCHGVLRYLIDQEQTLRARQTAGEEAVSPPAAVS